MRKRFFWAILAIACLVPCKLRWDSNRYAPQARASTPPSPLQPWVGTWADAGDAHDWIHASGRYGANLTVRRVQLRPDYLYEQRAEGEALHGVLPPSVLLGEQLDYTVCGEFRVHFNANMTEPLDAPRPVVRYTFTLRFDRGAEQLVVEYRTAGLHKQFRLRRVTDVGE